MKKFDKGKTKYSLIPADPLREIAEIMTKGAEVYGRDNWKENIEEETDRIIDAIFRHLQRYKKAREEGIEEYYNEQDWGHHHLSHVAVNAIFLIWKDLQKKESDWASKIEGF